MAQPQFTPEQKKRRLEAVHRFRAKNTGYDARWRLEHLEQVRESGATYQAKWRKQNPEEAKKRIAEWRAKNHTAILEYKRKWKAKHRTEETLAQQGRHTKTKIKVDKEEIINWESRVCGICNLAIAGAFHIDHIIPISKGGLHEVSNLQLAHPFCNLSKKDRLVDK